MKPKIFDIHSHLNFKDYKEDLNQVIEEMYRNQIGTIIVGTTLKDSKEILNMVKDQNLKDGYFYACIGIHPLNIQDSFDLNNNKNPDFSKTQHQLSSQLNSTTNSIINPTIQSNSANQSNSVNQSNSAELNKSKPVDSTLLNTRSIEDFSIEDYRKELLNIKKELALLASDKKVVAIGEIGLDYFHLNNLLNNQKINQTIFNKIIELQKILFEAQIEVAKQYSLPVMIHCRGAYQDVVNITEKYKDVHFHFHFFTDNQKSLDLLMKNGYSVSFPGVITFVSDLEIIVKNTPNDSFMVETDSPYAAPVPYRGKRNDPNKVIEVIKKIAQIKGLKEEEIAQMTTNNLKRYFNRIV